MKSLIKGIFLAAVVSTSAHATIWQYSEGPGTFGGGQNWGYDSITASYDDVNQIFSWAVDYDSPVPNGFWLAVSNGPNPKGSPGELALWYADATAGVLVAYEYSGQNNGNSWINPGNFLGDFSSDLSSTADTVSFSVDVSGINSLAIGPDWAGSQFGEKIGVWFHPFFGEIDTDAQTGEIIAFDYKIQQYRDFSNGMTTPVPVPAAVWLFGSALLGMVGVSRRKSA